jgi:hypothetical protein
MEGLKALPPVHVTTPCRLPVGWAIFIASGTFYATLRLDPSIEWPYNQSGPKGRSVTNELPLYDERAVPLVFPWDSAMKRSDHPHYQAPYYVDPYFPDPYQG